MEGLDGGLLDRADHAFGLAVGPGMIRLDQPVLDAIFKADAPEDMQERQLRASLELKELDAITGEHSVDFVRHGSDQRLKKAGGDQLGGSPIDAGEDHRGGAIDGDVQERLATFVPQFGNVDAKA
jgi:hypothetical protein